MAILSANLQFNRGGHGLLDYSSLQKNYPAALLWAQDVNSNAAVGQFIYLEEAYTDEKGATYAKGPYVVDAIGEGAVLTPLSKSIVGDTDLSGDIVDLKSDIDTLKSSLKATDTSVDGLKTTVGDAKGGLVKEVADLKTTVGELPKTFVKDVKVGDTSLVDGGVVDLMNFVQKDGNKVLSSHDFTDTLKAKLEGMQEIKSFGDNLDVDDNGKLTVTIPEGNIYEGDGNTIEVSNNTIKVKDNVFASKQDLSKLSDTVGDSTKGLVRDVKSIQDELESISGGVGSVGTQIDNAITALDLPNTYDKIGAAETAKSEAIADAEDKYQPKGNYEPAGALDSAKTYVDNKVDGKFDAAGSAAQALVDAKDYVDGKVDGKFDSVGSAEAAETVAKAYADELNTAMNTRVVELEKIDHDHANKAELNLIASGDKAKWDAATTAINDFLTGTDTDNVVNKLADIKAWMEGEGVVATELTEAIAGEAKLRDDADKAINDKIGTVTSGKTVVGMIGDVETAAKLYADGLAKNIITQLNDGLEEIENLSYRGIELTQQ